MVVIEKMGKAILFEVAEAASKCCDMAGRLRVESAKTPKLSAARDSALEAFEECRKRLNAIAEAGRSEEARYKREAEARSVALDERKKLKEAWDIFQHEVKIGVIDPGSLYTKAPVDPDSVVIPPEPKPMPDGVRRKYEDALGKLVEFAVAVDDADKALRDNECEVEKLERELSSAFERLAGRRKVYDHKRDREIFTTRLAREEEENIRKAEIAEAQAAKAEAEATLAKYGVS